MLEVIPPSRKALDEAYNLASEIMRNIELSEVSLEICSLKASRLARLLNDFVHQNMFRYEASGYPSEPSGIDQSVFELGRLAGRVTINKENGKETEVMSVLSIGQIEEQIAVQKLALESARDANLSITSANPNQWVHPSNNSNERNRINIAINNLLPFLPRLRSLIYGYASAKYYEIKLSSIADDIFSRTRENVDSSIGTILPDSVKRLTAIYDNLASDNPEDWSNAVHSCRRMLQDLADVIYPAREDKVIGEGKSAKRIKLGPDAYINRIIAFVEENSNSERFQAIVGSNLSFIGERLDAVFQAAQKGSHTTISDKSEADRYVIYTYLIVGDILNLSPSMPQAGSISNSV